GEHPEYVLHKKAESRSPEEP
ncbi:XRE family transcriptional regulator, partial [Escherichia coli]|nr:XRE family transcriptional regulator [Escherichia coli]MCH6997109.1 XRE family transcriptional regulator [Escherichia coli]